MKYKYSCIDLIGKNKYVFDGKGEIVDGKGEYAHLLTIHDCLDLTIKNITFKNGDTSLTRYLNRKDIPFKKSKISVFEIIDGGAVVITGKSRVRFENCIFSNNNSIMCGGAVSNQSSQEVSFYNCAFKNNTAGHTGAAIDNLTQNSNLIVEKCRFINNKSNIWNKIKSPHGQISIFPDTVAQITNSTFEKGSIPIDYGSKTSVQLENNSYVGFEDWEKNMNNRKSTNIIDIVRLMSKLYWLIPKTLGRVYYRVNK